MLSPSDSPERWTFEEKLARYHALGVRELVVFHVDAAPTSGITWRPLPRREYTKRHEYDVLIGQNKHVVRPDGWVREQDNEKRVLATGKSLVRERGQNKYVRAELSETKLATGDVHGAPSLHARGRGRSEAPLRRALPPRGGVARDRRGGAAAAGARHHLSLHPHAVAHRRTHRHLMK